MQKVVQEPGFQTSNLSRHPYRKAKVMWRNCSRITHLRIGLMAYMDREIREKVTASRFFTFKKTC
jgi:hypothetical protein